MDIPEKMAELSKQAPVGQKNQTQGRAMPVRVMIHSKASVHEYFIPHWHDEMEILVMLSGTAVFHVGEHIHNVKAGEMVVINNNEVHSTFASREGGNDYIIFFLNTNKESLRLALPPYVQSALGGICYPNPLDYTKAPADQIYGCVRAIFEELSGAAFAHELFVYSKIYELIGALLRPGRWVAHQGGTTDPAEARR